MMETQMITMVVHLLVQLSHTTPVLVRLAVATSQLILLLLSTIQQYLQHRAIISLSHS